MNFNLKLGKIVSSRNTTIKNTFYIRVIPDMDGIENSLLPTYPNFFSTNNYAYKEDDTVWLLSSDDFQVGFILGLSQPPAGENIDSFISLINKAENEAGFDMSSYGELTITKVQGSSISFINDIKGMAGHIYNNKTVILYNSDGSIWVKNPSTTISASAKGDITITGKTLTQNYSKSITDNTGDSIENANTKRIDTKGETVINASNITIASANKISLGAVGDTVETFAGKLKETIGTGEEKTIVSGGDFEKVISGDYTVQIIGGSINLNVIGGSITINPLTGIDIHSTLLPINIKSPTINLPSGVVAPNPLGGPFNCIMYCPMTGLPHQGTTLVGTGV